MKSPIRLFLHLPICGSAFGLIDVCSINNDSPLMLLCKAPSPTLSNEMKITLKEFEEFNISYINYNYNFIISNSIKEIITIFKGEIIF